MKIDLSLKDEINRYLHALCLNISEYSFANLYLFRDIHDYHYQGGSLPLIRGKTRENEKFIMPLLRPYSQYFKFLKEGECLFPIEKAQDGDKAEALDKDKDYMFTLQKLKTMEGRKLSSRRNLIHQFENNYNARIEKLTPQLATDAKKVLQEWKEGKEGDFESCLEALDLIDELDLEGIIIYEGSEPLGFILGEIICPKNYLMHFAKAKPGIKGLTPFMYETVANRLPSDIEWINMEPDLGIEELAQAKMAYQPDLLLPKYRVFA